MVKKALVEITLEMQILAMDFTKPSWSTSQNAQNHPAETVKSGK